MTLADFRATYPEFDAVPDVVVQRYLTEFSMFYQGQYGDYTDTLQGLYVAHYLTIGFDVKSGQAKPGTNIGTVVTSRSVGDVSVGSSVIGVNTADPSLWDLTLYGQKFKMFMGWFGLGPLLTGWAGGNGYGT